MRECWGPAFWKLLLYAKGGYICSTQLVITMAHIATFMILSKELGNQEIYVNSLKNSK